jgi:pyrroloquinoline quinone biosynthesis protein D
MSGEATAEAEAMAMAMADDAVPKLPRGVRLHEDKTRGRTVLLAPERALALDETGIAILGLTDGVRSFGAIVAELARVYNAPADVIGADVAVFFRDLQDKRMLDVTSS